MTIKRTARRSTPGEDAARAAVTGAESAAAGTPSGAAGGACKDGGRRLTLKDMVEGAGTTARAVRFYEAQSLIAAAERSRGGHRLFEEAELGKLRLVIDLRTCGFSIEEIREVLRAKAGFGTVRESAQAIQGILTQHIAELRDKINVIERLGREFAASVDVLDRCVHCTDPRGAGACSSCEVPFAAAVPPSFCHIWSVTPRVKPS